MKIVDNKTNIRYWVELIGYRDNKPIYQICSGYYLGSYENHIELKHIISNGDITSCVVRHIKDGELFSSKEMAYKKWVELQELEEK